MPPSYPIPQLSCNNGAKPFRFAQLAVKLAAAAVAGPSSPLRDFIKALPTQPVDLPVLWPDQELAQLR